MVWGLEDNEIKRLIADSSGTPFADNNNDYPDIMQLRFELCLAHHLFAHYKMDELVWNHLSVRVEAFSEKYLITSFPYMFEDITPQNLNISSDNYTGLVIHSAIYNKRPDVKAICHLHSPALLAVSCLQEGMQFFSQESAGFYGKVSYHDWEGMSDDTSEQERLGNDLGPTSHTLIMRNHGGVTVGSSIGEAFVRMWYLEKACRTQLTVMQSGGAICRPPAHVLKHTAKQFSEVPNPHGYSEWNALIRWFMARTFGIKGVDKDIAGRSLVIKNANISPIRVNDVPIQLPPVVVRGRKYLAGASSSAGGALFPSFIPQSSTDFPRMYEFESSNTTIHNNELIDKLGKNIRRVIDAELGIAGALLFKKMPGVKSAAEFSEVMTSIGYSTLDYSGGTSAREKKAAGVLTASSDPPAVSLEPHLEMAYNKTYPRKVFFFCRSAPQRDEGGETPIVDMQEFELALPDQMVRKLRTDGVRYSRRLPSASSDKEQIYTWQSLFFSNDKNEVEKRCVELGYDFSWGQDDSLSWSYVRPAFLQLSPGEKERWFNQATCLHHSYYNEYPGGVVDRPDESIICASMHPHDTSYGDGTPFSDEEVQFMRARLWERACAVTWSTGDLLVMDNMRVAHGRMSYSDNSNRSILVSLTSE